MTRLLGLAVLLAFAVAKGQEIAVPVDVQAPLLLKILTFDRKLQEKRGEPLRIGVLHQSRVPESRDVFEAFRLAMTRADSERVGGRVVHLVGIDVAGDADVAPAIRAAAVDVLYVTPLRGVQISTITQVTRERDIVSLTGVPGYVTEGLSVGIDLRKRRPHIVVNLAAHRAEGAEFSAQLLKVARIVR